MYKLSICITEVPTNHEIKNHEYWDDELLTDEIIENFLEFYKDDFFSEIFESPIIPKNGSEIFVNITDGGDYSKLVVLNNQARLWLDKEGESSLEISCKLKIDFAMIFALNHHMRELRERKNA